jgi:hypothetical protein
MNLNGHNMKTILSPRQLVQNWVDAFNRVDIDALANFYHEEAINHQVCNEPVVGKKAIKEMFKAEFARANMVCIAENIFEDGNWAMLEWKDPDGLRGCGFFEFKGEKIILQRGYWDKLSFLRIHKLPMPTI